MSRPDSKAGGWCRKSRWVRANFAVALVEFPLYFPTSWMGFTQVVPISDHFVFSKRVMTKWSWKRRWQTMFTPVSFWIKLIIVMIIVLREVINTFLLIIIFFYFFFFFVNMTFIVTRILMVALSFVCPRIGVLRTQELNTHPLRTQSSKVLPLKPGIGQNIAMHASFTARNVFFVLISTFPVHSPSFFQSLSWVSPVLCRFLCRPAEYNKSLCSLSQMIVAGSRADYPQNINRLQNMTYCSDLCVEKSCCSEKDFFCSMICKQNN